MKDFLLRNRIFFGAVLGTLLLIGGGVYLFSKSDNQKSNSINSNILVPGYAEVTSGISKGAYLQLIANAKVTLVEFGDYQCPACGAYNNDVILKLLSDFAGKINYVFRDFAFIGPESVRTAEATYCAADQNKYWQFHEYLYAHQAGENKGAFSDDNLKGIAKTLNLETNAFNKCLDSGKYSSQVDSATNDGKLAGVDSTPSFFINGVKIDSLPGSYDEFKNLVQDALNNAPIPSGTPTAAYHTHFDIKVYINGILQNYTDPKYSESKTNPLDPNIHFHDQNGTIVHVHAMGVALSELFSSIKVTFPADSSANNLKVYVNGNVNSQSLSYIPNDLDQILVSYGPINDPNIGKQISSVTNNACIYSLKCPAKGTPPPEDCVGGLGTGCSD